ncbi:hypothetical protein AURDEDRAFT_131288 [Auricularia subglabra TFB-10046 SS5]|uniref:MYND-type domain-containing protein n=1 Tax=Auricularia subglabra (strain TFB-10046 / SS5) TaxID=717982 RepID=J0WQN4_AURST|nr:hypothetical protein AURDEDRAFT_131288 [Auricularia subglabra TFB-10046 SS5]
MSMHPLVHDNNVRILRERHGDLLTEIMGFITAARHQNSGSELTLALQMVMPGCPLRKSAVHRLLVEEFSTPQCSILMITSLCRFVNYCFPPISKRGNKPIKFRFDEHWPSGAHELLPHGGEGFHGLLYWLPRVPDIALGSTLSRVFLWCRSTFYAQFIQEGSRSLFESSICQTFEAWLAQLGSNAGSDDAISAVSHIARYSGSPAERLLRLAQLLSCIAENGTNEWPAWTHLYHGYEAVLLAYTAAAKTLIGDDEEELRLTLCDLELALHDCRGTKSIVTMPSDVSNHFVDLQLSRNCFGHFQNLLSTLISERRCASPNCPRKPTSDEEQSVSKCGRCKILHYCSRDCQRSHWLKSPAGHKEVCRQLATLVAMAPVHASPDVFERACRALQLDIRRLGEMYANLVGDRLDPVPADDQWPNVANGKSPLHLSHTLNYIIDFARMLQTVELLRDFNDSLSTNRARIPSILAQLGLLRSETSYTPRAAP